MKRNNINPEIERKIDFYVNGKLDDQEVEELWVELIQNDDAFDYLKTVASLRDIAEREQKHINGGTGRKTVRNRWQMAAVAALVLIAGVFGLLRTGGEADLVEPIDSIELDYYRSTETVPDTSDEEQVIREAIILANRGDYRQALNLIESELEKTGEANSRALLFINAGSILYNTSMYEEAAVRFENVVNIDGSDPLVQERAYWYLGNTYFQLNQLDDARGAFQKAYELNGAYSRVAQSYLKALAAR
ncbi:MAG: tetratricopeptide repeat protein [Balneolaceae bacterium]